MSLSPRTEKLLDLPFVDFVVYLKKNGLWDDMKLWQLRVDKDFHFGDEESMFSGTLGSENENLPTNPRERHRALLELTKELDNLATIPFNPSRDSLESLLDKVDQVQMVSTKTPWLMFELDQSGATDDVTFPEYSMDVIFNIIGNSVEVKKDLRSTKPTKTVYPLSEMKNLIANYLNEGYAIISTDSFSPDTPQFDRLTASGFLVGL